MLRTCSRPLIILFNKRLFLVRAISYIILSFILTSAHAQKFEETDAFYVDLFDWDWQKIEEFTLNPKNAPFKISRCLRDASGGTLDEYSIGNLEFYEGAKVTLLESSGLDHVEKIVQVTIEHNACCSSFDSHYYLFLTEGGMVKLPILKHIVLCDYPDANMAYIFPNQKYGRPNKIVRAEVLTDYDGKITVTPQQTYSWTGSTYKLDE